VTSSLEAHVAALSELIRRDPYARDERSAEFVRAFVRPHGLDVRPADLFVNEMLAVCEGRSRVSPPTGARRALGRALAGFAFLVVLPLEARPIGRLLALLRAVLSADMGRGKRKRKSLKRRIRKRARVIAYATAHHVLPRPIRRRLRTAFRALSRRGTAEPADSDAAGAA
jgi:hypothetical protein